MLGEFLPDALDLEDSKHIQDFLKISFKDAKYRNVTHFLLDPSCSSSGMTAQPLTKPAEMQQLAKNQKEINNERLHTATNGCCLNDRHLVTSDVTHCGRNDLYYQIFHVVGPQ